MPCPLTSHYPLKNIYTNLIMSQIKIFKYTMLLVSIFLIASSAAGLYEYYSTGTTIVLSKGIKISGDNALLVYGGVFIFSLYILYLFFTE